MSDRRVIHKVQLFTDRVDQCSIELPPSAEVIRVGTQTYSPLQGPIPVMWYLTDPEPEETERRQFWLVGTGHPVPNRGTYVGTFQIPDGLGEGQEFVGHVFEVAR